MLVVPLVSCAVRVNDSEETQASPGAMRFLTWASHLQLAPILDAARAYRVRWRPGIVPALASPPAWLEVLRRSNVLPRSATILGARPGAGRWPFSAR